MSFSNLHNKPPDSYFSLVKWWAHWPTFSIPPATQLSRPTRHIKTSSSSSTSSSLIQSMVIQNLLCLGERRPSNTLSDSDGRLFACVFKSLKCVRWVPRSGFCLLWAAAAAGAASGGGSTSTPEIYDTPVPGLLYSKQTGGGGKEQRSGLHYAIKWGQRGNNYTVIPVKRWTCALTGTFSEMNSGDGRVEMTYGGLITFKQAAMRRRWGSESENTEI